MDIEIISSEEIFSGCVFDVLREQIRLQNGHIVTRELISHVGAVTILPIDDEDKIWFVRQYRHPTKQMLLELPAGTLEKDEGTEQCAARELREEIGFAAGELKKLGSFYLAPGYSSEYMHVYLASNLTPNPLPPDADEYLEVVNYPVDEVLEMVENGEIQDAKTIAALALAAKFL